MLSAYGPDFLREHDVAMARRDKRHRAKRLEQRIREWWWQWSRKWVAKKKEQEAKRKLVMDERERQRRRG